jgi:hypothetical protein
MSCCKLRAGVPGSDAKAGGKVAAFPIGLKSLVVSYLMLLNTANCTTITTISTVISIAIRRSILERLRSDVAASTGAIFHNHRTVLIEVLIFSAIKRTVISAECLGGKLTKFCQVSIATTQARWCLPL